MGSIRNIWSKSYPARPHHNLVSTSDGAKARFQPSYEKDCSEHMNWILAMEYGRIWRKERDALLTKRTKNDSPKIISPFKDWMKKHLANPKRFLFLRF